MPPMVGTYTSVPLMVGNSAGMPPMVVNSAGMPPMVVTVRPALHGGNSAACSPWCVPGCAEWCIPDAQRDIILRHEPRALLARTAAPVHHQLLALRYERCTQGGIVYGGCTMVGGYTRVVGR